MSFHVPTSSIPLLRDPPFVAALALLGAAIGRRALRLLRAPMRGVTALEHGALACALGLGLMQFLPYALGMAGVLTRAAILVGLVALAALFASDLVGVARAIGRAAARASRLRPPAWMVAAGLAVAIVLAITLVQTLNIYMGCDDGYHLTAPKRWLQAGRLVYLPTFVHTNAPMGVEMLYTLCLAVWSDTAAKLLNFAFGLLVLLAIFVLGRRLGNAAVGFVAAALWLYGLPPMGIDVWTFTYVDLAVTFMVLAAVIAWLQWQRTRSGAWLIATALCAGLAVSVKLTAAFVVPALLLLTLLEQRRANTPTGRGFAALAGFAALSVLPALPWVARTWLLTGNPVYPELSSVFPSRDVGPAWAATFGTVFKYYYCSVPHSEAWSLATRKVARWAALGLVAFAAGGVMLALRSQRARLPRLLALLAAILLLGSLLTTGIYFRQMLPAVALLHVLIALCLARVLTAPNLRWAQWAIAALLILKFAPHVRTSLRTLRPSLEIATGRLSRDAYLSRYPDDISAQWEYANRETPPDSRLLVTFFPALSFTAGHTFLCDRMCTVTDAYHQDHYRLDTWDHYLADVRRDGITHLVTMDRVYIRDPFPDYAPARNEVPFAHRLAAEYGTLVNRSGGCEMYRLDGLRRVASGSGAPAAQ